MLRDLKETTKFLILLEIVSSRPRKMNSISSKLGITVQGTSDYIRAMSREGLVKKIGGEYRATKKGVDLLQERMLELKNFVDSSFRQLEIVDVCGAIAGNDIKKDEEVGLFMEDGVLLAYAGKRSSSTGYALFSAKKGEDLAIKDLSGMVSLRPGRISVLQVPSLQEGGTHSISLKKARKIVKDITYDRVAVLDVVSKALANLLGVRVDFDFAPISSSIEASLKGLDILAIASRKNVPVIVSELEAENSKLEDPIPYEVKALK